MWHKLAALSMALGLLWGGMGGAQAETLEIAGLGKLDFGKSVTVTDGGQSAIGPFMIAGTHQKGYGKTARAAMWSILTVPPGMNLYPEKPPFPYDSMHLYQLRTSDVRGTYSVGLFVIQGKEEDFFHEGNRKAARFWQNAFRQDAERPVSLFGMPKIQREEFQSLIDRVLEEKKDASMHVEILSFTPWRAVKNEDGSYRWNQEAKVIITNPKGLSFPMWLSVNLLKAGDTYYLIEINGSHTAEEKFAKNLLMGFYQMKRE